MPNGSNPFSSAIALTSRLVDVPMTVSVPPAIETYESGNMNFDGLRWKRRHRSMSSGMKIATTAVLLRKPDSTLATTSTSPIASQARDPVALASRSAAAARTPVFTNACPRTSIAPTVTTALLLRPRIASSTLTIPNASKTASINIAVTSIGNSSRTNKISATTMSASMKPISKVTLGRPGVVYAPRAAWRAK